MFMGWGRGRRLGLKWLWCSTWPWSPLAPTVDYMSFQALSTGTWQYHHSEAKLSHQGSPRMLKWVADPFSSGSAWPRNRARVSCTAGRFFTNWAIREAINWPPGLIFLNWSIADLQGCVISGVQQNDWVIIYIYYFSYYFPGLILNIKKIESLKNYQMEEDSSDTVPYTWIFNHKGTSEINEKGIVNKWY